MREWIAYLRDIGLRELHAPAARLPRATRPAGPPAVGRSGDAARTAREPLPTARPLPSRPAPAVPPTAPAASPAALFEDAFDGPPPADPARRLVEVREELGDCTRCKLAGGRTQIVFGVGNPRANLMFVGEGPGRDEDLQGEPFVGRAGKKLDEMIQAIGLARKDVYIANVVKCRPPNNRDPEPDEVETCSPFLFRQIEAIRPRVIVTLGGPATKLLLNTRTGITRLRGTWQSFRGIPVMPTFHPAFVLRNYTVETRRRVYDDLLAARARMDEGH